MADKYLWAVNRQKLEQAIVWLKKEGKELTEKAIRGRYIQQGGLVRDLDVKPKKKSVSKSKAKAKKGK